MKGLGVRGYSLELRGRGIRLGFRSKCLGAGFSVQDVG